MKNIRIFCLKNCHFLVVKFSVYLNRRVFVMFMFCPVRFLIVVVNNNWSEFSLCKIFPSFQDVRMAQGSQGKH